MIESSRHPGSLDTAVVGAYVLGVAALGMVAYLLWSRAAAFIALAIAILGVVAATPTALRAPADSNRRFFAAAAMALNAVAAVAALVAVVTPLLPLVVVAFLIWAVFRSLRPATA